MLGLLNNMSNPFSNTRPNLFEFRWRNLFDYLFHNVTYS